MYIQRTLMFRSKKCYISQAIHKKEITGETYDYVTLSSIQSYQ